MLDPPGTIRTPEVAVKLFTGYVALSKNGCLAASMDISTVAPIRKPSKMPFLTQAFTRQPVFADESGSAARISPEFKASLKHWKRSRCCCVYSAGFFSNSCSISAFSINLLHQAERFEHTPNLR